MTPSDLARAPSSEPESNQGPPEIQDVDILFVEDSPADIELAVLRLKNGGFRCRYRVAETEQAHA